jgi:hypothetical protein
MVTKIITVSGRRLLSRWAVGIPDPALARRGHVAFRDIIVMTLVIITV